MEEQFIRATEGMVDIIDKLSTDTPGARPDSAIDERPLTTYFTGNIMPNMSVSLMYWYCWKHARKHVYDLFVLGGERIVGSLIRGCKYTGSSTYYPLHNAYRKMIDYYSPGNGTVVLEPYKSILPLVATDKSIVVAHIPDSEDHCMVLSHIWSVVGANTLVLLHYSPDNDAQYVTIQRMIQSLPGVGLNSSHRYQLERTIILSRDDRATLYGTLKPARVNKRTYTLQESPVFLAVIRYAKAFTEPLRYEADDDSSTTMDFSKALGDKLAVYIEDTKQNAWTIARLAERGTKLVHKSVPSNTMRQSDPVFVAHLWDVVNVILPQDGPSRVWVETSSSSYLECLLQKWPSTFFLVCTRSKVDITMSLARGVPRHGRVIAYSMRGTDKMDDFVDKFGQENDSKLVVK